MLDFFASNFKKGISRIKENPQLTYTLFVSIVIFFAFIFVSNNFISIAQDAQERLVNVRIGSIQDVFSEFAYQYFDEKEELNQKIKNISDGNETIVDFEVYKLKGDGAIVIASLEEERIGEEIDDDFLYDLATINPGHSLTVEDRIREERFFRTARAVRNEVGDIVGIIHTRQTLSRADQMIDANIKTSIFILVGVILLVMFLFLRHAKIIDYAVLYERIKQVNQMKDEFISMVSHELRTPLTAIRGYADMLKDTEVDEEQEEYADNIDIQSKRLNNLIEDILDTSRIEQGKLSLDQEPFDPEDAIKETVDSLQYNAKQKDLKLFVEKEECKLIIADEDRLKQILTNLVGNSIKYTEEGEVKVNISTDEEYLVIKVIDTGIGMTAEQQKGLFKKFYRVKSAETDSITGTGLGLWITRKLIEMMNGEISVESIKGKGTHVIFKLPLSKE